MNLSDLTSKTPEELNVMCAELCGTSAFKTECEECYGTGRVGSESDSWPCDDCDSTGIVAPYYYGPNYTGSWDAIIPEVRKLKFSDKLRYRKHLQAVVSARFPELEGRILTIDACTTEAEAIDMTRALILTLHP